MFAISRLVKILEHYPSTIHIKAWLSCYWPIRGICSYTDRKYASEVSLPGEISVQKAYIFAGRREMLFINYNRCILTPERARLRCAHPNVQRSASSVTRVTWSALPELISGSSDVSTFVRIFTCTFFIVFRIARSHLTLQLKASLS